MLVDKESKKLNGKIRSNTKKALKIGEARDPIRSLWRNVLIVALEDAVGRHWY